MTRSEFSADVRKAAWKRCGGKCEKCTAKLFVGKFQYDHVIPDGLGGEPTLENCQVLCTNCHHVKTVERDRPPMQKADNVASKHFGYAGKTTGFWKPPGYKHQWGKRS